VSLVLPCVELFDEQDAAYKESVLPSSVTARVSVEMASTFGWERYTGLKGKIIGMRSFGASAPLKDLLKNSVSTSMQWCPRPNPSWESESSMKIVIGADHAGFQLKNAVGDLLRSLGHTVVDVGAFNENPSDYPDFALLVGNSVLEGKGERGILICGSGVGVSVAANKIKGIRAAVCHDTYSAHQGVEHDDMNVLFLDLG